VVPLRGAPTTHYKMTIDLNKAVANAPESARAGLQEIFNMYSSKTLPADVWIDSDGRLRKMQYTATVTTQGHTTTANTAYELYDFGTPVNATPPPANQVSDLQTLLKQSGGR